MLEDYNVVHFTIHLDGFEIVIYNKRIRDLNHCLCIFWLHPNLHSPVGPVHNNCWQKLVWSLKCFEGCINSNFNPVWPILDYYNPNKNFRFLIFQIWVQVSEAVHLRCTSRFFSNQHSELFLEYLKNCIERYIWNLRVLDYLNANRMVRILISKVSEVVCTGCRNQTVE